MLENKVIPNIIKISNIEQGIMNPRIKTALRNSIILVRYSSFISLFPLPMKGGGPGWG
jgi:hypothetical protein